MNVDLNNTNEYDKQVIFLDSKNGTYNDNNSFDFYIKFEDPIKNISNVKIIDASLILKSSTSRTLSNDDIYYIELNEYHRTFSYFSFKVSKIFFSSASFMISPLAFRVAT